MPIRCQPALCDEVAEIVNRGQAMPSREFQKDAAMSVGDSARQYDQTTVRLACSYGDGTLDVGAVPNADHGHMHVQGRGGGFDGTRNADLSGLSRIHNDRDANNMRRKLLSTSSFFPPIA